MATGEAGEARRARSRSPATTSARCSSSTVRSRSDSFVSSVAQSYGDALVAHEHEGERIVPWYRAIRADGQLAGFMMVAEPLAAVPHPYLWRFLIDWRYQRRGVGARAIRLLAEQRAGARRDAPRSSAASPTCPERPSPSTDGSGSSGRARLNDVGRDRDDRPIDRLRDRR